MKQPRRREFTLVIAIAARAAFVQASPLSQDPVATVQYEASFYAQFSPRTALDMINHTPGFTLESGEEGDERRGFEGAVANVLVDGQRPLAKKQTTAEVLQRIPASRVARIEILRGADVAGDASGSTVLANVVLIPSQRYGIWSVGFEFAGQHRPAPNGFVSAGGRYKATDYAINVSSYSLLRELPGTRRLVDGFDAPTASRAVESPRHFYEYAVNGQIVRPVVGGSLELTAKADRSRYHDDTSFVTTSSDGTLTDREDVPYGQRTRIGEVAASYRRTMAGWDVSLLALVTQRQFESQVTATRRTGATVDSRFAQGISQASRESIMRSTFVRDRPRRVTQAGIETTINTLDGETQLTLDLGNGPFVVYVPNLDVQVRERRIEAFASHTWRPDAHWSTEGRISAELSRLRFHGDVTKASRLLYVKPSFHLSRSFGRNQLYGRIFRSVGQLDFTDFVSAASLADRQLTGGNPDLRPESSWRSEIGADLRMGTDAAFGVTAFHELFDDVVDWVPWGDAGSQIDAPGNLGRAAASGLSATIRSPVPRIAGVAVTAAATMQTSAVTDPVTGAERSISERERVRVTAGMRQTFLSSRFVYGADYTYRSARHTFRLQEVDRQRSSPSLDIFLESHLPRGLRLRVKALSVLGSPELRDRTFFEPDRAHRHTGSEHIRREPGNWWLTTISGSF
jgi:hypothetical protein